MMKKSGLFKSPGQNKLKFSTNKSKVIKEEFQGLSAKQLVDRLRGN